MSAPIADQLDLMPKANQARRREAEPPDDGGFARLMAQHQDSARPSASGSNADGAARGDTEAAARPKDADGRSARQSDSQGKNAQPGGSGSGTASAGAATAEASQQGAANSRTAAQTATAGDGTPAADGSRQAAAKSLPIPHTPLTGTEPTQDGSRKPVSTATQTPPPGQAADAADASGSRTSARSGAASASASQSQPGQARTAGSASRQSTAANAANAANANKQEIDGHAVRVAVNDTGGKPLSRTQGPVDAATAVAVTTAAAQSSATGSTGSGSASGQSTTAQTAAAGIAAQADQAAQKAERGNGGKDRREGRAARPVKGLAQAATSVSNSQHGQQSAATDPAARAEAQLLRQAADDASQRASADARHSGEPAPDTGSRTALRSAGSHGFETSLSGTESATSAKPGAEVVTRGGETQSADRPTPPQPVSDQVAVRLQKAAANGRHRVSVRLEPAELGRIDVKVDIGKDGVVRALVSADRAETLDILQRDSRELDKALQNAGLKTDSGSLDFNLRGDGDRDGPEHQTGVSGTAASEHADAEGLPQDDTAEALRFASPGSGRIDIRI